MWIRIRKTTVLCGSESILYHGFNLVTKKRYYRNKMFKMYLEKIMMFLLSLYFYKMMKQRA